ncbi:MAG: alkaline phosphatase family protein [Alphaproteobacteria bacterium]|nr:alkaline phosphatase family protein [Alphaproteobacteria bacterium]
MSSRVVSIFSVLMLLLLPLSASAAERTVVLVMFDGFAPAMADATKTPALDRIKQEGAWSRHLIPVYPSLSLPNHTSYVTGCLPARHGIVQNGFIDPTLGKLPETADADWMTGCESVWQAAERQGVPAAAFNFWNRVSKTKGKLASIANEYKPWAELPSDEAVLTEALGLLKRTDAKRPRLIALYFRGPDHEAHVNGVTSPQALAEVRKADRIVGKLMGVLKALGDGREGTLIVGTDHGMMKVDQVINLPRIINRHGIRARDAGDGGSVYLYLEKGESVERVEKALSGYSHAFTVHRTGQYPGAYAGLGSGKRLGDLMLVVKPPYYIAGTDSFPWYAYWLGTSWFWSDTFTPDFGALAASHGYDTSIEEMHGVFYAWGAGIAQGKEIARVENIDVHPTVMHLLGLQPGNPVDGKVAADVLAVPPAP